MVRVRIMGRWGRQLDPAAPPTGRLRELVASETPETGTPDYSGQPAPKRAMCPTSWGPIFTLAVTSHARPSPYTTCYEHARPTGRLGGWAYPT